MKQFYRRDLIAQLARRLPHQTQRDVNEVVQILSKFWFEEVTSGNDVSPSDIGRLSIEAPDMAAGGALVAYAVDSV